MAKNEPASAWRDPMVAEGFEPLRSLWEGPNALYPSEQAVRWARRQLDSKLVAVGALCVHRRMLYVHRQKLIEVARDHAIQEAAKRCAGKE